MQLQGELPGAGLSRGAHHGGGELHRGDQPGGLQSGAAGPSQQQPAGGVRLCAAHLQYLRGQAARLARAVGRGQQGLPEPDEPHGSGLPAARREEPAALRQRGRAQAAQLPAGGAAGLRDREIGRAHV